MGSRIKRINVGLGLLIAASTVGLSYEALECWKIEQLNRDLSMDRIISSESYPYQSKFFAAYLQGKAQDYKHAVQSYSQLLEITKSPLQQSGIEYNIGNNLFLSALRRRVNEDGTLKDEAKYDLSQAKVAYEQALRLDPSMQAAKFNLSLLLSVMPQNMKTAPKEQSGVELSNLPIGMP